MTCIAAIKHRGRIYLAADRRISWDIYKAQSMPKPKVTKRNGVLLAGTGNSYLCSLVVNRLTIPKIHEDTDVYVHEILLEKMNKLLERKGFYNSQANCINFPGGYYAEILVGVGGRLYSFILDNPDNNFQNGIINIDEVSVPYATGCGGDFALGSLLTTEGLVISPQERLKVALTVAACVSPGCDAEIDIKHE